MTGLIDDDYILLDLDTYSLVKVQNQISEKALNEVKYCGKPLYAEKDPYITEKVPIYKNRNDNASYQCRTQTKSMDASGADNASFISLISQIIKDEDSADRSETNIDLRNLNEKKIGNIQGLKLQIRNPAENRSECTTANELLSSYDETNNYELCKKEYIFKDLLEKDKIDNKEEFILKSDYENQLDYLGNFQESETKAIFKDCKHLNKTSGIPLKSHVKYNPWSEGSKNSNKYSRTKIERCKIIPTVEKEIFQCKICDKTLSSKSHLTRHVEIHIKTRNHACNICNKVFVQKYYLTLHMRTHTSEKPFFCNQCEKAFSRKQNLTKHLRIHTDERPFICTVCNRTFSRRRGLSTHIRVHRNEEY